MHTDHHDELSVASTALVVDDSFASRARITTLLRMGGWQVHHAIGTDHALRQAALLTPDLVVTDMVLRQGHGATLMRRLREERSTARFLVVAARRTQQCRALAAGAGAIACLAKPVDPRLFVDVMRGLGPAAVRVQHSPVPSPETGSHAEEMFVSALPHRLSTIAIGAQSGDSAAVAVAAETLAVASDRLGHAEVAFLSNSIARDARRGMVSHGRLVKLVDLCARLESRSPFASPALRSA